ncbi:O-antigen polymerase [Levilactobacillus namurensis]|uniref:O-antigen polymerase n=1 Tax=Levilactobacillus namurensis TaxID=380393 RepID=UPI001E040B6B|nr:O-antigen polymerase [Levilactobacillus namurensis]HJE45712.1 oligosaccharide repeat unit polymerase [Levilactobacillus namurensis]
MGYLLLFFICIVGFIIFIRHDLTHPLIYFLIPWILCLVTYVLDIYGINSQVNQEALNLVTIGTLGYIAGVVLVSKKVVGIFRIQKYSVRKARYRNWLVKPMIVFTAVFNIVLVIMMVKYMQNGISYAYIRDLLYSYNSNGAKFFTSSIMLNIYNIIDVPMTYVVAPIAVIELFSNKLNLIYKLLSWISVGAYVVATGGRLIIMFMLFQFIFALGYYYKNIPWKKVGKVALIVSILGVVAFITTLFRTKSQNAGSLKVNSAYAYFNINLPILSNWVGTIDTSGVNGKGFAFFGGIFQFVDLVLNKFDVNIPLYEKVASLISLPQKNWIEIYSGNWYNAFDTMFYDLYIDFRLWGVLFGSMILGGLSKWIYVLSTCFKNEKFVLSAMVMVEILVSSFFRWQFGTFTFTAAFVLSFLMLRSNNVKEL